MQDANARIDDAAINAGLHPTDVRRIATISGDIGPDNIDRWVDQLTQLALELGFSTFIRAGDDPTAYPLVAQQIAPRVREQVARERG